jgi:single-strand DNA-binding protein
MPESINSVTLVGRLGKDPELRHTGNGTPVCSFSIAVDHRKRGEETPTSWFDVTVWGAQGEACATYLHKGSMVGVNGYLQQRKWQDKDGNNRYAVEVVANNTQFLTPKGDGNGNGASRSADDLAGAPAGAGTAQPDTAHIPF